MEGESGGQVEDSTLSMKQLLVLFNCISTCKLSFDWGKLLGFWKSWSFLM